MASPTSSSPELRRQGWRQFFLVLGLFLGAFAFAREVPTPGSWSDVRSQRLPAALASSICVAFIVAVALTYSRGGPLSGFQTMVLCVIFGGIFAFMACELFSSVQFMRKIERTRESLRTAVPNLSAQHSAFHRSAQSHQGVRLPTPPPEHLVSMAARV